MSKMPRWVWVSSALALLLIVSIASVTFSERSKLGSADQRMSSQHELLGIEVGDTVFVGDDLTAEGLWNELFPYSSVRNRGINGQSTNDLLLRIVPLAQAKPARIVLNIGANDVLQQIDETHTMANYIEIINLVRNFSPNTSIIVSSALPLNNESAERTLSLNAELQRLAERQNLKFIDLAAKVLNENGTFLADMADNRYRLLGPGYQHWQTLLRPHLPRLI